MRKKLARWILATLVTCSFAYAFARWGTGRDERGTIEERYAALEERYVVPYREKRQEAERLGRELVAPVLAELRSHRLANDAVLVTYGNTTLAEWSDAPGARAELLDTYRRTMPFVRDVERALASPERRAALLERERCGLDAPHIGEWFAWATVLRLHAFVEADAEFGIDDPETALDRIAFGLDLAALVDDGTLIGALITTSMECVALDGLRQLVAAGSIDAADAVDRFEPFLARATGPGALRAAKCSELAFLAAHPPTREHRRTCTYPDLCGTGTDTIEVAVAMMETAEPLWRTDDRPASELHLVFTEPNQTHGVTLLEHDGRKALLLLELELRAYREEHGAWPTIAEAPVVLDPNTCAPIAVATDGDALRLGPIHTIEYTIEPGFASNVLDPAAWARLFGTAPRASTSPPLSWEEAEERGYARELR